MGGRLLWGDCKLVEQPTHRWENWGLACVQARLSSDLLINAADTSENAFALDARAYAGFHLLPWLSWHLTARRDRVHFLVDNAMPQPDIAAIESSYAQIGNPVLHHFRIALGRVPLPYGLDFEILPSVLTLRLKDRQYWTFPRYSARLTYDNQLDTVAEIGIASDKISDQTRKFLQIESFTRDSEIANSERVVSSRLSHDISALGGTRVMIFHLHSESSDTRYGAAIVNEPRRDSATSVEWQRRFPRTGPDRRRQQLFRISYWGPSENNQRFYAEYEGNRTRYWMLTFGQEYSAFENGRIRFNLGYFRRESGPQLSHFFLNSGLEVKL
jgi:hypothetical protein